jgi:hypothetical protein
MDGWMDGWISVCPPPTRRIVMTVVGKNKDNAAVKLKRQENVTR